MVSVTDRRAFGSILLSSYLPCAYHTDPALGHTPSSDEAVSWQSFEEITNGVWRPAPYIDPTHSGSGTTCGFLPSWFLWRIGCADRNVVNRTCAAADGTPIGTYTNGDNICAVRGACNTRRHSFYVPINGNSANSQAFIRDGLRPKLGDIIHVNTQPGTNRDHVFIFMNNYKDDDGTERWQTAEAGGPTPEDAGKQMHVNFWREQAVMSSRRTVSGSGNAVRLLSRNPGAGQPVTDTRFLMGWVDLDKILLWKAFVLEPGRQSSVSGYPPPAKLPNGEAVPWSVLAAGGGILGNVLPGVGMTGAPPGTTTETTPNKSPFQISLPGGIQIPNPFG